MPDIVITILESDVFISLMTFLIGAGASAYLKDSVWKKVFRVSVDLMAQILQETDIDVPDFIEKLIMELHSTDMNTKKVESILQDEKVKKSK